MSMSEGTRMAEWYSKMREQRQHKGMSLRELERLTGVRRGLLSRYENGKVKQPNAIFLKDIAAVPGVTVDWMMS